MTEEYRGVVEKEGRDRREERDERECEVSVVEEYLSVGGGGQMHLVFV